MRWYRWVAFFLVVGSLAACEASTSTVQVKVVSDFVAGPEAALATVELFAGADRTSGERLGYFERVLVLQDALSRGLLVAAIPKLRSGTYTARVALRRPNGSRLGGREIIFDVSKDATLIVHITADCEDVACPNAGGSPALSACLAGTCVDPRCSVETPEHCPENLFCHADADCGGGTSECATATCVAGVCVLKPTENACDANEYCARADGCMSIDSMTTRPDVCGRICAVEAEPCTYGYYACVRDGDNVTAVCTSFVHAEPGTSCGNDLFCDARGQCVSASMDAGVTPMDAQMDALTDARLDAPRDARADAPRDARVDMATNPCAPNPCGVGTCERASSAYSCTCPSGYVAPTMGGTCADINECAVGTTACAATEHCENEPGTFSCHAFMSITAGYDRTCALFEGGYVKCWGRVAGQDRVPATAIFVGADSPAMRLYLGTSSACVLREDGNVKCWGLGGLELGYGDSITRDRPPEEALDFGGHTLLDLSYGYGFACALLDDHSVRCWGPGGPLLGYGDSLDRSAPPESPVDLGAGTTATAISVGGVHACAILNDGGIKCWGRNFSGQLGVAGGDLSSPPSASIDVGDGARATAIASTFWSSCALFEDQSTRCWGSSFTGIEPMDFGSGVHATQLAAHSSGQFTCAKLSDGNVRCWGGNGSGELGDGTSENANVGLRDPIDFGGETVTALTTGSYHACAVLDGDRARCWGANESGVLGYGTLPRLSAPSMVTTMGASAATNIAMHDYIGGACALDAAHELYCWGSNGTGFLGLGDTANRMVPTRVTLPLGSAYPVEIRMSGHGQTCALMNDHALYCWGANNGAQLGYGDYAFRSSIEDVPVDVDASRTVLDVASFGTTTCALLDDHSVKCWGYYDSGFLTTPPASSIDLGGGRTVLTMSGAADHMCLLLDDHSVRCFGENADGQLGYGDNTGRSAIPSESISLGSGEQASAIYVGYSATCAQLMRGGLKCWGRRADGSTVSSPSSIAVDFGDATITHVAVTTSRMCVALNGDDLRCWGQNNDGGLGYGDRMSTDSPRTYGISLPDGASITSLAMSPISTCVALDNGELRCWGDNSSGQLGNGYGIYWAPPLDQYVNLGGR